MPGPPTQPPREADATLFRALVEQAPAFFAVVDDDDATRYLSPTLLGTTEQGPELLARVHPDDRADLRRAFRQVREDGGPVEVDLRIAAPGPDWLDVLAEVGTVSLPEGRRVLFTAREYGERRRPSRARGDTLLKRILDRSRDLISVADAGTGHIVEVNAAWLSLLGRSRDDVIGLSAVELGLWGSAAARTRFVEALEAANRSLRDYPVQMYTPVGGPRQLLADVDEVEVGGRRLIVVVAVDRTEANLTEAKLREAQRMEAIGQLTGGVAHDFNNLLGVVLGNADLLQDVVTDDPDALELVQIIIQAAERGAGVTRQLLAFARKQTLDPHAVDVGFALRRMLPLFRTTLGANIRVDLDVEADLPPAFVDDGELETAVLNLIVNARDAMPAGGRLALRVRSERVESETLAGGETLPAGEYLALAVEDSGTGMDAATAERVFEPFFTTKDPGRGTGLGLSMVFGFVRQSGGHARVDSELGRGTTVTILLPPTEVRDEVEVAEPQVVAVPPRGETVLVLEDVAPLRRLTCRMLAHLGYGVIEAADEAELAGILDRGEAFDLLLSDIQLSGPRRGPDLAEEVVARRPGTRVLFITGYSEHGAETVAGVPVRVLPKPFGRDQLSEALRATLEDQLEDAP